MAARLPQGGPDLVRVAERAEIHPYSLPPARHQGSPPSMLQTLSIDSRLLSNRWHRRVLSAPRAGRRRLHQLN